MKEFLARWGTLLHRIALMPVAFLGVGLYRAWLATFFRFGAFPHMGFADYAVFEISIGVVCLIAAALTPKIAPLWSNRRVLAATGALSVAGSAVCVVESCLFASAVLKYAGLVLAGAGLALLILVWCEFFGALNPMRVAIYHAAGIFFGELFCWLFMGLDAAYIMAFSIGLPVFSLAWARRSMERLPEVERPHAQEAGRRGELPWKPILLMATCTFATGFGSLPDQPFTIGNVVGVLSSTAFVFFGSLSNSRWFNFDTIYRLAFPLMTACLLLVTPLLSREPLATAACFDAGYTMLSMFVMIVLSNITYRFGISSVWLNGIERGIRYLVEALGWLTFAISDAYLPPQTNAVVHFAITAAVIAMFLVVTFSEKNLSARWGIDLRGGTQDDADVFAPGQLALRVSDLSKAHKLSDREEEVLQLIARKVPIQQMEESLFVAQGTIKAHTSRIYRKLGVHSKEELFELLGIEEGR